VTASLPVQEEELYIHYKNDLKRHARTDSLLGKEEKGGGGERWRRCIDTTYKRYRQLPVGWRGGGGGGANRNTQACAI
jgi:hypothetical protein